MSEAAPWFDLVAAATRALRDGLARAGIAEAGTARVGPSRAGDSLLTGMFAPSSDGPRPGADRLTAVIGDALATPPSTDLPALHIEGTVIPGRAFSLSVDPSWVIRAINDLPDQLSPAPFPASVVINGGSERQISVLRIHATLMQANLPRPPPWRGMCDAASRPLLRCLLGAARAARDSASSPAWMRRLSEALDAQWRDGPGSVMRLIDPHDAEATQARLALAGRAAALLARAHCLVH